MRRLIINVVLLLALLCTPGTIQAADITDGALGIPWGSSPAKARQLMEHNNYSFLSEVVDPSSGLQVFSFKGMYATYTARVYLKFMLKQMVELDAVLWESDNALGVNIVFKDLSRLLSEKYGPWTRDTSFSMLVGNKFKSPITQYQWDDVGGAGLGITLRRSPEWSIPGYTWEGRVSVEYKNNGLYEKLKLQSQENI